MTLPSLMRSRRSFLAGLAVTCVPLPASAQQQGAAQDGARNGFRVLRAYPNTVALAGHGPTAIWSYEGMGMGATLRVNRGEELRVRLINDLPDPTAVHWHGVRLPNAMDGAPGLTQ